MRLCMTPSCLVRPCGYTVTNSNCRASQGKSSVSESCRNLSSGTQHLPLPTPTNNFNHLHLTANEPRSNYVRHWLSGSSTATSTKYFNKEHERPIEESKAQMPQFTNPPVIDFRVCHLHNVFGIPFHSFYTVDIQTHKLLGIPMYCSLCPHHAIDFMDNSGTRRDVTNRHAYVYPYIYGMSDVNFATPKIPPYWAKNISEIGVKSLVLVHCLCCAVPEPNMCDVTHAMCCGTCYKREAGSNAS